MPEEGGVAADPESRAELPAPASAHGVQDPWKLIAYSKRVVKGWQELCRQLPGNSVRCYNWLQANPTNPIPRRCYELKHKKYAGCWCYEVGSGERLYYKPRKETRDVLVYYAGPHPPTVPYAPEDI